MKDVVNNNINLIGFDQWYTECSIIIIANTEKKHHHPLFMYLV